MSITNVPFCNYQQKKSNLKARSIKQTHPRPKIMYNFLENWEVILKNKISSCNNSNAGTYEGIKNYIAPGSQRKTQISINTSQPFKDYKDDEEPIIKTLMVSQIAERSHVLYGSYISTLLYVIKIKQVLRTCNQDKNLTMYILSCYAYGYTIDITILNSDLSTEQLQHEWFIFSGFQLKQLPEQKFELFYSFYSKIYSYKGLVDSQPYQPTVQYINLSSSLQQINLKQISQPNIKNINFSCKTETLLGQFQIKQHDNCCLCKKTVINH